MSRVYYIASMDSLFVLESFKGFKLLRSEHGAALAYRNDLFETLLEVDEISLVGRF